MSNSVNENNSNKFLPEHKSYSAIKVTG